MSQFPDDIYHVVNDLKKAKLIPESSLPPGLEHLTQTFLYKFKPEIKPPGCPYKAWSVPRLKALAAEIGPNVDPINVRRWHKECVETGNAKIDVGYASGITLPENPEPVVVVGFHHPVTKVYGNVVADGNHRLYRAWQLNRRTYPACVLSLEQSASCELSNEELRLLVLDTAMQDAFESRRGRPR